MTRPRDAFNVSALLPIAMGKLPTRYSYKCNRCGWHDVEKVTEAELRETLDTHWQTTHEEAGR